MTSPKLGCYSDKSLHTPCILWLNRGAIPNWRKKILGVNFSEGHNIIHTYTNRGCELPFGIPGNYHPWYRVRKNLGVDNRVPGHVLIKSSLRTTYLGTTVCLTHLTLVKIFFDTHRKIF